MEYEKTRREFYESEIHNMASQLAELLDKGFSLEIAKSRSGLKIFAVTRRHEVVRRKGNQHE